MERLKYIVPDMEALEERLCAGIMEASGEGERAPYGSPEYFGW